MYTCTQTSIMSHPKEKMVRTCSTCATCSCLAFKSASRSCSLRVSDCLCACERSNDRCVTVCRALISNLQVFQQPLKLFAVTQVLLTLLLRSLQRRRLLPHVLQLLLQGLNGRARFVHASAQRAFALLKI